MIKLTRSPKPSELTDELQQQLTEEFEANGTDVWRKEFIREALYTMAHGKCVFCECKLGEESKYLEVEHFAPKSLYPKLVVEWCNLLASCKRCNLKKRAHDVITTPIVNPYEEDPREHLNFSFYRFHWKTLKGKTTIELLCMNDIELLIGARISIGEKTQERIDSIHTIICSYLNESQTAQKRNRIIGPTKALLKEGQPCAEYSATVASVITDNPMFGEIKENMENLGWWDGELESLYQGLSATSYAPVVRAR